MIDEDVKRDLRDLSDRDSLEIGMPRFRSDNCEANKLLFWFMLHAVVGEFELICIVFVQQFSDEEKGEMKKGWCEQRGSLRQRLRALLVRKTQNTGETFVTSKRRPAV